MALPSREVVMSELVSVTTIIETTKTPKMQTTKIISLVVDDK
jgi:hypothetical protein